MSVLPLSSQQLNARRPEPGELVGEGEPTPIALSGGLPSFLLLHGFSATPRELDPIADVCRRLGLAASGPLLPGHGTHARDLATTRFSDWLACAESSLMQLAERGPVIVCGHSMGSVLAMRLASRHPRRVCAAIFLASATRLHSPYPSLALSALYRLRFPDFQIPKRSGPDIGSEEGRHQQLNYNAQPLHAAESLRNAGIATLKELPKVNCPCFIAHGAQDRVCPVGNAWELADRLGTNDKQVLILPRSRHIITKDVEVERLVEAITHFTRRVLQIQASSEARELSARWG